jgi:hypothetical protein
VPPRQKTAAAETRRLKKMDFKFDFSFMVPTEFFQSAQNPEMMKKMLSEILKQCQHISRGQAFAGTGSGGVLRTIRFNQRCRGLAQRVEPPSHDATAVQGTTRSTFIFALDAF